jgi:hypothetical protein
MGNVELAAFVKRQYLMFKAVKPARFCGSNHFDAGRQHVRQRFAERLRCLPP